MHGTRDPERKQLWSFAIDESLDPNQCNGSSNRMHGYRGCAPLAAPPPAVPEPAGLVLLGTGPLLVAYRLRRS